MSEHQQIRALLALAAAGALDAAESRRVESHVAGCAACAAELEDLRVLSGALRALPTPQPAPNVVARTRALAEAELASRAEQRSEQLNLVFLLLFAWTLALAGWMVFRLFGGGLMDWLQMFGGRTWVWLAVYAGLGWLASSMIAVILIGQQQRSARRMV